MGSKLLDVLIQLQNKSGSIKAAPPTMQNLKQSIQGVPFQLLTPSMSGVPSVQNLVSAVTQLSSLMGGLQNLGSFQSILGKLAGLSSLSVSNFSSAMGPGGMLGAALTQYGGAIQSLQQGPQANTTGS